MNIKLIFKRIAKFILPSILIPKNIIEIYCYFARGKDKIKYEKSFYKRHAFVNKSLRKFNNPKYLEIGVASNDLFDSIPLKLSNKYGVDPVRGGNFRMTSDRFFTENQNIKFDTIFIDGLHCYEQVQKDVINSIMHLNKNYFAFLGFKKDRQLEKDVPELIRLWLIAEFSVCIDMLLQEIFHFFIA
jgi:hypothetical protein